jgi:hypothetical protein
MPGVPGQDTEPQAPLSDTMERMLRPQGIFQPRLPPPAEWQQPYPPAPGGYPPPGGQYPQANPYQQGSPYPPAPGAAPYPAGNQYPAGGQYPPAAAFQQAAPPQPWSPAPTGAIPPAAPGQPPAGYGPGGQYPQGAGYQDPYGNGQFAGGQYGQEQFPGGQYGPGQFAAGQFGGGVQYGPDGQPLAGGGVQYGPDGQPLAGDGAGGQGLLGKLPVKRPRLLVGGVAGLVIIIVIAVVLSSQGGSSSTGGNGTAAAATSPSATTSSAAIAMTQGQAATALSGLLSQSGGDRADVSAAVFDVEGCGNSLAKDAQVFNKAAANRRTLLTKLAQLPGRSALSPAMITDLTGAWQASATVDSDLAKWAQDQVGHCKQGNTKDPNYTATIPFDSEATNDKNAFVKLWNPLAKKDGLPTRQSGDL